MNKNTKIIAIAGGVLILVFIIFSAVTKGGCGSAVDVWANMLGCDSAPEKTRRTEKSEEKKADQGGEESGDLEEELEGEVEAAPREEAARPAGDTPTPADD